MALEHNNEQHYREVVDKYVNPVADYAMTTRDYVVRPAVGPTTGPITVTLPPVAEAVGRWYSIVCRDADVINTVTITHNNDSECWANDIVFNGKCDRCLFYSDGLAWYPGCSGGFPQAGTTYPPGTTAAPTSAAPTSAAPTSAAPTSAAPTSAAPTSAAPTTAAPTTAAPTTAAPTTQGG